MPRPEGNHRTVNIEIGRPTVEEALVKLTVELERARSEKLAAMTVIHGYGASGKGGAIRAECRKLLDHYLANRVIRSYIPGENFSKKAGTTKALLRRLPQLASSGNLGKRNRGITVVEL
ncbi:MAG TPA: Smr/MutS family protein [Desulfopila sp.]|nr:Smr/MutS family protein [Desulfopila sp.]